MTTKTLLAVLAHPDDESFGLGGTLALYARRGCDVYYVCATRGEAGSVNEQYLRGFKDAAEMRTAELRCAAKYLGLREVYFLGYRDSGMPDTEANRHPEALVNHPVEVVAGLVVGYIRGLKPDIVLTFDPIGGYRHPDHIHIHRATKLAFEKANDASFHPESGLPFKPLALYYQVFPRRFLRVAVRLLPLFGKDPTKFGSNGDINLKEIADVDFPVHVRLKIREVLEIKRRASACHASQDDGQMQRGFIGLVVRMFGEHEDYMRAYPPTAGKGKVMHDLFDGI